MKNKNTSNQLPSEVIPNPMAVTNGQLVLFRSVLMQAGRMKSLNSTLCVKRISAMSLYLLLGV